MVDTEQTTGTARQTARPRFRRVGVPAAALVGVNVGLMYLVAETPLAEVPDQLFSVPLIGLVVFAVALTGGNVLAEHGLERGSIRVASLGIVVLQGAYAVFGGGVLAWLAVDARDVALAVTLLVTLAMTLGLSAYVYLRDRDLENWRRWSMGAFLVGVVLVAVGTLFPVVLIGGFVFIFLGFTLLLGYDIWQVHANYRPDRSLVHALGIYVAFTGVFVHALQVVTQWLPDW